MPIPYQPVIRSLDTETTGTDLYHGARPFLVTGCNLDGDNIWWEWDVNPLTRQVEARRDDLLEIQQYIDEADILVLQNTKFDYVGLSLLFSDHGLNLRWYWNKVRDTLLAGHLLASNHRKTLDAMVLEYLSRDITSYEKGMKDACTKARTIARNRLNWRIAKAGLPEMPSAKETVWKYDSWLPRAILKYMADTLQFDLVPAHDQQPTVGRVDDCDVRIGRASKWGNPYRIGQGGMTRQDVIRAYARAAWAGGELAWSLPDLQELYGKRLGCHCAPDLCHGDVLRTFCHPWMTITSEYANVDSLTTVHLWKRQEKLIKDRKLDRIYAKRLEVLPIVPKMEGRGITINRGRVDQLTEEYKAESEKAGRICVNIAKSYDYDLKLPKSGNNKSLIEFCFGVPEKGDHVLFPWRTQYLGLPIVERTDSGNGSLDKVAVDKYLSVLPPRSKQLTFIKALANKRKRDTAVTYMEGYRRFWLPLGTDGWFLLHPSLNPTGTDTLRFTSSNPNEQNISKKEGFNLRYCFGPAPGREWWSCDAKNVELRIPAYESGEEAFITLFEKPDEPPYYGSNHLLIFHIIWEDLWNRELKEVGFEKVGPHCKKKYASTNYQWTKNGNFAVQYGAVDKDDGTGTADTAYHQPGAQAKIKSRFKKQDALNQWCIRFAEQHGYIETLPDRSVDNKRGYPLLCTRTDYGKIKPTVPLNYRVQGTAMWWMMMSMIRCQAQLDQWWQDDGFDAHMVMQVHDELVFDFPKAAHPLKDPARSNLGRIRDLQRLMEQNGDNLVPRVPTPTSCEYHEHSWSEGVSCG